MKTNYQKHLTPVPGSREDKLHTCLNTLGLIARVKDREKLGIYTEKEKNRLIERLEQRYQNQLSKLSAYEEAKEHLLNIAAKDIPCYDGESYKEWYHEDYMITVSFEVWSKHYKEWHGDVYAYEYFSETVKVTVYEAFITHIDSETVTNVTDELSEMIEL